MSSYVKSIEATGIYGRFDLKAEFQPGVNIVHGKNGTGKTTLLHVMANILNGEYKRFAFLTFKRIQVWLDDDAVVILQRIKEDDNNWVHAEVNSELIDKFSVEETRELLSSPRKHSRLVRQQIGSLQQEFPAERRLLLQKYKELEESELKEAEPLLPAAYFPAFRTMIDAWASIREESERRSRSDVWTLRATRFAREWFGSFVPSVNYPSLLEIEQRLTDEIQHARLTIGRADRELLSKAFLDIFASLSEKPGQELEQPESILQKIRSLFDRLEKSPLQEESTLVTKVYAELRESIHELDLAEESERTVVRVLNVYRELLERIVGVQELSFMGIQKYLESVNEFLEGKRLIVDPSIPRYHRGAVGIEFDDGTSTRGLRVLSSGERQIVTLIYAATHMSKQEVVLIDEPEISLHVDWQRQLLAKMSEQMEERQIIACTHSPTIGADYDRQVELKWTPTDRPLTVEDSLVDADEEIPF